MVKKTGKGTEKAKAQKARDPEAIESMEQRVAPATFALGSLSMSATAFHTETLQVAKLETFTPSETQEAPVEEAPAEAATPLAKMRTYDSVRVIDHSQITDKVVAGDDGGDAASTTYTKTLVKPDLQVLKPFGPGDLQLRDPGPIGGGTEALPDDGPPPGTEGNDAYDPDGEDTSGLLDGPGADADLNEQAVEEEDEGGEAGGREARVPRGRVNAGEDVLARDLRGDIDSKAAPPFKGGLERLTSASPSIKSAVLAEAKLPTAELADSSATTNALLNLKK